MRSLLIILLLLIGLSASAQSWSGLNQKVLDFANANQLDSAYTYGTKALAQAEAEFGKKHFNYYRALNILALVIDMSGDFAKAELLYLQAVDVQKQISGTNHADYIAAVSQLAATYREHNDLGKTIFYLQQVTNLIKQLNGDQSGEYAKALENLGAAFDDNGEYENAEPLFLQSKGIRKKIYGESHPAYASILNNLALLYQHQGKYNAAVALYKQSMSIKKEATGDNNTEYAVTISNLASLYCDMGDYEKAEPLFLQALKIDEKEFGSDSPEAARSLNNLATYYFDLKEDEKARNLFIKALSINRRMYGNIHEEVAVILNNLGQLYQRTDEFDKAEESYLEAVEIRQQTIGKEHPRFIGTIMGLAGLYYQQKKYNEAAALFEASLPIIKLTLGDQHPTYALGMNNLSLIYTDTKRYKEAERLLLAALAIAEKNGNDPSLADYLNNLGLLYRHKGDEEKTNEFFKRGFEVSLNKLKQNFNFLTEQEKERFSFNSIQEFSSYQSFYLDYIKKKPEAAITAFEIELASKGMILNTGVEMRSLIKNSGDMNAIDLYDQWSALKGTIAKEYSQSPSRISQRLTEMENEAGELEKKLARISSSFKQATVIGAINWRSIQSALKQNEAVVEFASFKYRSTQGWTDSTLYVAFVLRKTDPYPQMIALCEEKQLDSILKKPGSTNESFISILYRGLEGTANQSLGQGKKLFQLIWKPLDHLLKSGDRIHFSPTGILHQIAFAAIPWDTTTLLSGRYKMQQWRSSSGLASDNKMSNAPFYLTLFGGIDYGQGAWNYLPGTLDEIKGIASLAEKNKISYQLFDGKKATEENFKANTGRHTLEIIHIASHGFFFPDPKKGKSKLMQDREPVFLNAENPLNRSGIVLAGANLAWTGKELPEGVDDGILTAYEVGNRYYGETTRMVVLSACETGLGDIRGKEGVFGLQRAFKLAGVEFLLMSLWKVPDAETAEFMEYFYSQLFTTKDIVGSFLNTQNYMKKKYPKQPYKWAAFVLVR